VNELVSAPLKAWNQNKGYIVGVNGDMKLVFSDSSFHESLHHLYRPYPTKEKPSLNIERQQILIPPQDCITECKNIFIQRFNIAAMLCGSLITTAWRVLRLRIEGRPSDTEGSCEYIE